MKTKFPAFKFRLNLWPVGLMGAFVLGLIATTWGIDRWTMQTQQLSHITRQKETFEDQLASVSAELLILKNIDQYKRNEELNLTIRQIEKTYSQTILAYEDLLELKGISKNTAKLDEQFSNILATLARRDYALAANQLTSLRNEIVAEQQRLTAAFVISVNVPASNNPPGAGYSIQTVQTDIGQFLVAMIAGDLSSARVIVDTASDSTCLKDCPVLSLADYVARNGAFAGVNGSYFCPADYPSCADKKNSFDTLLMNKNKVYFNSDNNVYSTVPAVIFGSGWTRFVGRSLEWGRDTSIDGMIAMQPLLVSGNNVVFGGDADPKKGVKGNRSFVADRGNTVYIGVVFNATVAESARVMKTLGMNNALNLDDGGSTALWFSGYKVGPGRNIPNAILFVRR